tara:strand:- start:1495 stop:1770 length:276 start_codon:yes stop_codon:yes gene_type:complete
MGFNTTSLFTQVISTKSFTITQGMGLRSISFVLVSGVGQFKGTKPIGVTPSEYIPLVVGQPVTISAEGPDVLDQIEVDSTSGGVINFMAKQ